jgi:hypothetical protein
MDHAGDNVLPGAAFSLNQNGYVGTRELLEALTQCAHSLGAAKNNVLRGNFA